MDMIIEDCEMIDKLDRPIDDMWLAQYLITVDTTSMKLNNSYSRPGDLKMLQQLNDGRGCRYNGFWSINVSVFCAYIWSDFPLVIMS